MRECAHLLLCHALENGQHLVEGRSSAWIFVHADLHKTRQCLACAGWRTDAQALEGDLRYYYYYFLYFYATLTRQNYLHAYFHRRLR